MINPILYVRLFYEFLKIGLFSVGGGMATLPFLSELSTRTGWFSQAQLANMVAVAESTPGPIGINMATYVGFSTAGVLGGIIATLGLVSPSIIVILIIAKILSKFKDSQIVNSIFYFLRPASLALIFCALISLMNITFVIRDENNIITSFNFMCFLAGVALFLITNFLKPAKKMHPITWIGIGALFGIFIL